MIKDDAFMELRETRGVSVGQCDINRVHSPAAETLVILAIVVGVFNAVFFRELSQLPAQCNPVPPGVVNSLRQICRDPFFAVVLGRTQKGRIGKKCARKYRVDYVFTGRDFM